MNTSGTIVLVHHGVGIWVAASGEQKPTGEQALHSIGNLYEIERQAKDMNDEDRRRVRQEIAAPIEGRLHE